MDKKLYRLHVQQHSLLTRWLDYLQHERFVSKATLNAYESDLRRLMDVHDPIFMTWEQFRAHMAELSRSGLKQSTLNRKLAAYRVFWSWALMERLMKIDALKFEDDEIVIRGGKGGKDRRIPMPPRLRGDLMNFVYGRDENEYVFPGRMGKAWCLKSFYHCFRQQLRRAGINDRRVTPHIIRHTYITMMARAGVHDVYLQALSGHADPKSLVRYRHADPERIKEAALRFPLNT